MTATVVVPVTQRRQMDWSNLLALLLPLKPLQSSIAVAVDFAWLEWTVVAVAVAFALAVVVVVEEKNDPAAFHPYSVAAVVA